MGLQSTTKIWSDLLPSYLWVVLWKCTKNKVELFSKSIDTDK